MNHHTRSFSEQQPSSQLNAGPTVTQPESFIRIHSDSQQSLDQLFNPTQSTGKPLRHRNLPASFFKQSLKEDEPATIQNGTASPNGHAGNLHSRSVSFDHRSGVHAVGRSGFHMRTQSTLAPMPRVLSNQSSNQSSQEMLNYDQSGNRSGATCGHHNQDHNHPQHQSLSNNHHHHHHCNNGGTHTWSNVTNSSDNLMSPSSWVAGQTQSPINSIPQHSNPAPTQQQQPMMHTNYAANGTVSIQSNQGFYPSTGTNNGIHQQQSHHHHTPCVNSIHNRSISFGNQPVDANRTINHNMTHHMRTHSTIAPMQATPVISTNISSANSHHSSHQSSHEFLNKTNGVGQSGANWSSSGYSTDDLNAGWSSGTTQPVQQTFAQQAVPIANQQQIVSPAPVNSVVVHSHHQHTIVNHQHQAQHEAHQHHMHHVVHAHNHEVPMQQVEVNHAPNHLVHQHHHQHSHVHPNNSHHHHHHHHRHQAPPPQQVFYNA